MANPGSKLYSKGQALRWALDIASALEYLHMRTPAVFHRDVKLSNILCVRDECGQSVAKLSDFGLHVVSAVRWGPGRGVLVMVFCRGHPFETGAAVHGEAVRPWPGRDHWSAVCAAQPTVAAQQFRFDLQAILQGCADGTCC